MIQVPDDILQQLIAYCQENDIAMATVGVKNDNLTLLIMARKTLTPDQASIIAAHMLLSGVISGGFTEDNLQRSDQEEKAAKAILN